MAVLVVLVACIVLLVLVALVDLVNATDMEQGGRLIVAGALILLPPLGVLLWMSVRLGRAGVLLATGLVALGAVLAAMIASGNVSPSLRSISSSPSFGTQSTGFSVHVP